MTNGPLAGRQRRWPSLVLNDNGKISAKPLWTSTNMVMPDPPVVANGVVYALSTGGQAMQNGAKPGDPLCRASYDVSSVLRSTPVIKNLDALCV